MSPRFPQVECLERSSEEETSLRVVESLQLPNRHPLLSYTPAMHRRRPKPGSSDYCGKAQRAFRRQAIVSEDPEEQHQEVEKALHWDSLARLRRKDCSGQLVLQKGPRPCFSPHQSQCQCQISLRGLELWKQKTNLQGRLLI